MENDLQEEGHPLNIQSQFPSFQQQISLKIFPDFVDLFGTEKQSCSAGNVVYLRQNYLNIE